MGQEDQLQNSPENGALQTDNGGAPVDGGGAENSVTIQLPTDGGGPAPEPDDGFTAEERAQWEAMRNETAAPAAKPEPAADDAAAQAAAAAAAAAAAKPADQPGADDDDDEGDQPKPGETPEQQQQRRRKARVSAKKYQDEKTAREAAETALRTEREKMARVDERMRILTEALTTPKPGDAKQEDDDPRPDPEADIYGYVAWQDRQREKLEKALADVRGGVQQRDDDAAITNAYNADAAAFVAQEPHFQSAYEHLMASRVAEVAMYLTGKDVSDPNTQFTDAERNKITSRVLSEERQLAQAAIEARRTNPDAPGPAKRIFMLAKARGWQPPTAAAAAAPAPGAAAAPAAAAAAAAAASQKPTASAAPPAPAPAAAAAGANGNGASVMEHIERIKAGQDAALSLSGGGAAPVTTLTPQRLADMPEEDFNAMVDNLTPDQWKRLMGGA